MSYFINNSQEIINRKIVTDLGYGPSDSTLELLKQYALDDEGYHYVETNHDPNAFGYFKGIDKEKPELFEKICNELGEGSKHIVRASVSVVKKNSAFWYHKDNGRYLIIYVPLLNCSETHAPFQCIFNNQIHAMEFTKSNFFLMDTTIIHGVNNLKSSSGRYTLQLNLGDLPLEKGLEIFTQT